MNVFWTHQQLFPDMNHFLVVLFDDFLRRKGKHWRNFYDVINSKHDNYFLYNYFKNERKEMKQWSISLSLNQKHKYMIYQHTIHLTAITEFLLLGRILFCNIYFLLNNKLRPEDKKNSLSCAHILVIHVRVLWTLYIVNYLWIYQ